MGSFTFFDSLKNITIGDLSLATLLSAVLVFIICYIAIKIITACAVKVMAKAKKLDGTLRNFILTALRIALWALAIIIVAGTLGIPTASLVAVVSVAGLALSLAIQNTMSNLFAGITLLATHPFGEGDYVDIGSNSGTVSSVGLFYTVIMTLDSKAVHIPNGDVTASAVTNYSSSPRRRVDMTFSASYNDKTESVKAAISDAIGQDGKIFSDPAPFIVISKYGDSSVEYIVRVWCKNEDYWDVYFGMNERVRECFERRGVTMTYNHLNVHVVQ